MNLTVLGNNGTCPVKDGACSSFLLQTEDSKVLIDIGNGSVAKLQHVCDLSEIDTIIISHLHFDHLADLFPMKYALETRKYLGEDIHKINLYIPPVPEWIMEEIITNDVFNIMYISDGFSCVDHGLRFTFKKVQHIIDSFAVRVESNMTFVYSSDSAQCPELEAIAKNADVFLCESTVLDETSDSRTHHLSARQAAQIARDAGVKMLLLTHFSEPLRAEEYRQRAQTIFSNVQNTVILDKYQI